MPQHYKNDLVAMREILEQMREHLERLRKDNRELKEENHTLRIMLMQQREPTRQHQALPVAHRYRQETSLEEATPMPYDYGMADMHGKHKVRTTMNGFGSMGMEDIPFAPGEGLTESFDEPSDLPSHHGAQKHAPPALSGYLGAGADADDAYARGTQPAEKMPRPAMDLGFINKVSADELDALPYGLVVLDTRGDVLFYNETESALTGFARERVIGKNFFTKVAPCTQVKAFQGRFEEFVRGELGRVTFFDFAFHFELGTQNVLIGLSHGRKRGHINVMMVRK